MAVSPVYLGMSVYILGQVVAVLDITDLSQSLDVRVSNLSLLYYKVGFFTRGWDFNLPLQVVAA